MILQKFPPNCHFKQYQKIHVEGYKDRYKNDNDMKTQEQKRAEAIALNEKTKICPKEQAKLARQLRKLGLL